MKESRIFGASVTPDTLKSFLVHNIKLNISNVEHDLPRIPICVWGERGIGKTDIVMQLKEDEVVSDVVYLPIAQIEEMGDLLGLPDKRSLEDGRTVTEVAPPSWVPIQDVPGIILIDDFNRADIRIIRGIMQLLQKHEMMTWSLPKKYTIVLTANPEESDQAYQVTSIDPAMLTRMRHVTLKTSYTAWLKWADAHKVDNRVMSFIARYSEMLAPEGERTCPRSWAMFANAISPIQNIAEAELVRLHGLAVLDSEAVDAFIKFVDGELDKIVPPEEIWGKYTDPKVRARVLEPLKTNRTDIEHAMLARLIAYISNFTKKQITQEGVKNVITLLEEKDIPKDMKVDTVNQLSKGPLSGHLLSSSLAEDLYKVTSTTQN